MNHSTALSGEPLAAQAVAGFLDKVGIKVQLKTIEPTVRLEYFLKASPDPLFTWGGGYANLMDAAACLVYYKSNPGVSVRYKNPQFDQLYDSMRADTNTQSRIGKVSQMSKMLREDLPVLWEFVPAGFIGVSTKIQDFVNRGDGHIEFDTIKVRA
jgi:ABC-type transport system substrate-binding protein